MKLAKLKVPQEIVFGDGAVESLKDIILAANARRCVLFTDQCVYRTGICDAVIQAIGSSGADLEVIDDLSAEPSEQDIERTLERLAPLAADLIVAVGGGSVMDTAKLCACLYAGACSIRDALENPGALQKGIPTVMIPTTCGTGSEATCNAIVAVPSQDIKIGIVNTCMMPDYVILDPLMIRKLPPKIIAATGVDALAHAVECYTSNKATPLSDLYALESARLVFSNIVRAYSDPDDMEAKRSMMLAAFYGGVAISASGTTAVHALSYPLGGKFHIAHGVANAILLAPVMRHNRAACSERLARIEDALRPEGVGRTVEEKSVAIIGRIEEIVSAVQIPRDLNGYGVTRDDIAFLTEGAAQCKRLLQNNLIALSNADISGIYLEIIC